MWKIFHFIMVQQKTLEMILNQRFLESIVCYSIVYTRFNGVNNPTTICCKGSAFVSLNILVGIHALPQVHMYWNSDKLIGIEGLKKMIPKKRFCIVRKYIHLINHTTKDHADLLCKVSLLINRLEEKFSAAYVPGKNSYHRQRTYKIHWKAFVQAVCAIETR